MANEQVSFLLCYDLILSIMLALLGIPTLTKVGVVYASSTE